MMHVPFRTSTMDDQLPTYDVRDNMVRCGINNDEDDAHEGDTDAERIAHDIFRHDFNSVMTIDMAGLSRDFKIYSNLTVAEGRIRVRPDQQKNIRAFIQWGRDQIRMGHDPTQTLFDAGQTQAYIDRLDKHSNWVKKSTEARRPEPFTEDMLWEEWHPMLVHYLRKLPGANGIPLNYVIREDSERDPTPHSNFLDDYVSMARLSGQVYDEDRETVYTEIVDLVSKHTRARGAILALGPNNRDGRSAYFAVKTHFEGEGILQVKVTNAEWTIDNLFYASESPPTMYWVKFEQELNKAFAVVDMEAGRAVYTNEQKLRKLQKKIRADFLQQQKIGIDAALAHIPMTMNYSTAMTIYRNAVRNKYPVERQTANQRRRVSEANQGRTEQGNNANRGKDGKGNGKRNGNGNRKRNHPNQETIVLMNKKQIKYHPSYRFTWEELNQMTQGQRDRLTRERAEYRRSQGREPKRNTAQSIAEMSRQISALQSLVQGSVQSGGGSVPGQVSADGTQQSQISRVTIGSAFGGRNGQANEKRNNQRS